MQYQHDDDWHPTNVNNAVDDTSVVTNTTNHNNSSKMNQGTFEVDEAQAAAGKANNGSSTPTTEAESQFSMEASLSRIDALSQSLSDLTRKRVGGNGHYRAKKRPSIDSSYSGMGTSICSGSSLAIDELASIDSTFLANSITGGASIDGFSAGMSASDLGFSRMSLGGNDDASTTSARFGNGNWSLQDMEPWMCSICTYQNEPVFLACDICGQTRGASSRLHHINAAAAHQSSLNSDQERTRIQQEQRMREFQEMQLHNATESSNADLPPVPNVIEAKRLKRKSKRKSREAKARAAAAAAAASSTIPPSTTEESHSPKSQGSQHSTHSSNSKRKSSPTATSPSIATTTTTTPAQPELTNTAPLSPSQRPMDDASLQNVFEFSSAVVKPRKSGGMDESTATERTFDMDQSNFTHNPMDGSSMMDQSYLGQSSARSSWNANSRRAQGSGKYSKGYRYTQWFEGMDEISDEISV